MRRSNDWFEYKCIQHLCYGILLEIAQIIGEVLYFVVVKDFFMLHQYFWCKRSRLKFAINLVLCWWRSDGNMLRGRKLSIERLWWRVEMECFEIFSVYYAVLVLCDHPWHIKKPERPNTHTGTIKLEFLLIISTKRTDVKNCTQFRKNSRFSCQTYNIGKA